VEKRNGIEVTFANASWNLCDLLSDGHRLIQERKNDIFFIGLPSYQEREFTNEFC